MDVPVIIPFTKVEVTKLQECDDALFGTWDMATRQRMPGIVEKVSTLTKLVKLVAVFTAFNFVHDLGVPTQEILPVIGKVLASVFGS